MRLLAFLLMGITATLSGQTGSSLSGRPGAPFRVGFGADGVGMGNALTAAPRGSFTGYYNPALTAFQSDPVVIATAGFLSLDRTLNFLSFSRHLPPSAGIALGVINAGVSEIDGRDNDGRHTEMLSTSENAFLLSFALQVDPNVAIGISTKILYYSLSTDVSSTTVGFDFGAVVRLTEEWTVGLSVQDVGSKYKWDTSKLYGLQGNTTTDFFPVRKKAGISYKPGELPGIVSAELEYTGDVAIVRSGVEYSFIREFTLRGGFDQLSFSKEITPRPSLGFSTETRISTVTGFLSYAFVFEPYSPGGFHLLSLGVRFD